MFQSSNFFKGQLKYLILMALSKENMHGYMLMQKIRENCDNLWQPTAGSLYPALEELKKEKLIQIKHQAKAGRKKKEYAITSLGKKSFLELSKQIKRLKRQYIEYCRCEEKPFTIEDIIFFKKTIFSIIEEIPEFKETMLEFGNLAKQGKILGKQKKEFKKALMELLEKIKKINKEAKNNFSLKKNQAKSKILRA